MAKQQIEQSFKSVVDRTWETLRALGFRKQGKKFRRHHGRNADLIEFQRSQFSDGSHVRFTINLGVVSGELMHRLDPEKEVEKASVIDAHVSARIGSLLPSAEDHWWQLTETTDAESLATEVANAVQNQAVPFLNALNDDDKLIALWKSGRSPGITDGQRQRYLALLSA